MKKKLLTVLLAVVMVFGVFGLTACSGSNADADYNYYGVKYNIEDEVKIEAVTFQAVYKMFTSAGNFLLYVDSSSDAAKYQAVNKLANDWNVTIYHFNPELTGGYAKDLSNAVNSNICTELEGVAAASQLKAVQDLLISASNKDLAFWTTAEGKLLAIAGKDSTVSAGAVKYNGKVSAANTIADGAKSIAAISIKKPSYGAYTEEAKDIPYIPEAYSTAAINTMNLFGDERLHIYDDRVAIMEEKSDVFVTVANYEMFAHLIDNNEGYFAVFFGGTWCPNTQAILYHVNYVAKDYGIEKVYFFDPRLDDGVRLDQVVDGAIVKNKGNVTGNLNTRNNDNTGAAYNYNFAYGSFLANYLPTYWSEWNITAELTITVGSSTAKYTRMCVPNIMMFNGEEEGKAELIALAEAEYVWANTGVEGNPYRIAWEDALKAVYDANPYAIYNPVIVAPEADDNSGSSNSGSSNGGAASGGDSAC